MAQSIGAMLEVIILFWILQKQSGFMLLDKDFWRTFGRMLFATLIAGCMSYSMTKFLPLMAKDDSFFIIFPKFCLIALVGIFSYVIASYFLNIKESNPIIQHVKKIIFRNIK